jgi:cytochrome P450 family 6
LTDFPYGSLKGLGTKYPSFIGFDKYYDFYKGSTKAVGLYFFMSPKLMILDIELIKNIFIRDFTSFHDRGFYYNKEDDPLSANLVNTQSKDCLQMTI